jgi:hypothetical protein
VSGKAGGSIARACYDRGATQHMVSYEALQELSDTTIHVHRLHSDLGDLNRLKSGLCILANTCEPVSKSDCGALADCLFCECFRHKYPYCLLTSLNCNFTLSDPHHHFSLRLLAAYTI